MRTFADYGVRYRLVDNQQYFVLFPIQSMQNGITKAVRVYKGVVSDDDDVKVTVNTYPRYIHLEHITEFIGLFCQLRVSHCQGKEK